MRVPWFWKRNRQRQELSAARHLIVGNVIYRPVISLACGARVIQPQLHDEGNLVDFVSVDGGQL